MVDRHISTFRITHRGRDPYKINNYWSNTLIVSTLSRCFKCGAISGVMMQLMQPALWQGGCIAGHLMHLCPFISTWSLVLIHSDSDLDSWCRLAGLLVSPSLASLSCSHHFRRRALGSSAQQQYRGGQRLHAGISGQRHLQCHQQYISDSAHDPRKCLKITWICFKFWIL